jgi:hypothetical protein
MGAWGRIAIAFALSLAAGGAIQQLIMASRHVPDPLSALPQLGVIVALISITFAIACRRSLRLTAINRAAATLLCVMFVLGLSALIVGIANLKPGIAGDIVYALAVVANLYFLLPAAAAVPIHWLLLRAAAKAG